MKGVLDQKFQKILVARHSPKNECFANEGDILFAPIAESGPEIRTGTKYFFRSVHDPSKSSRFGWVCSSHKAFNVYDFVAEHLTGDAEEQQLRVLSDLFSAISLLPDDTPVAGSYFLRGIENRHLELDFHRVFLHHNRKRPTEVGEDE